MSQINDNYFIKEGYIPNTINYTLVKEDVPEYWDDYLIKLSNYYQYHAYLIAQKLIREHGLNSVIDIGCGPAIKLNNVVAPFCKRVVGVDQESAIKYCKTHHKLGEYFVVNLEEENVPLEEKFDLLMSVDVIEHLENPDLLLNLISKLSHKGSYVLISTPERDIVRGKNNFSPPNHYHIREWNSEELSNYLESRGFKVEKTILCPPMKFTYHREYLSEWIYQLKKFKSFNYNQVKICTIK